MIQNVIKLGGIVGLGRAIGIEGVGGVGEIETEENDTGCPTGEDEIVIKPRFGAGESRSRRGRALTMGEMVSERAAVHESAGGGGQSGRTGFETRGAIDPHCLT